MRDPELERITDYLRADHARLHAELDAARGDPFDEAAYDRFRRRLLRHIAIEEKVLFPAARAALGDDARRLKVEHAAIGMLLVPTPDRVLADELAALLSIHDAREEADAGVYARCEAAIDAAASRELAARATAFPEVRAARYVDRPGARRTVREALAAADTAGIQRLPPRQ